MKHWLTLFFLTLCQIMVCAQNYTPTAQDSLLVKAVQRSLAAPQRDSTGIMILHLHKTADSIEVKTLYSSLKDLGYSTESAVNRYAFKYIASLPNGFTRIVPVHFYYRSESGLQYAPTEEADQRSIEAVKTVRGKTPVLPPVDVIIYPTVR